MPYKCEVVEWYHTNGWNKSGTARHFDVPRSCVQEWIVNEHLMLATTNRHTRKRLDLIYGAMSDWPTLDEELVKFVRQRNKDKRRVGICDILREAINLAKQFNYQNFRGSYGYVSRFCKRSNLSVRRIIHIKHKKTIEPERTFQSR